MRINYLDNGYKASITLPQEIDVLKKKFPFQMITLRNNDHVRWLSYINNQTVNIYDLYLIYKYIEKISDFEFDKLLAIYEVYKPNNVRMLLVGLEALITSVLIRSSYVLQNDELLTKEVIRQTKSFNNIRAKEKNFIEYAKAVRKYPLYETTYGYLFSLDGFKIDSFLPTIITPRHERISTKIKVDLINETNDKFTTITMPTDKIDILIAKYRVGEDGEVSHKVDLDVLQNYVQILAMIEDLLEQLSLFDLNNVARLIYEIPEEEIEETAGYLSLFEIKNLQTFKQVMKNRIYFEEVRNMSTENDKFYKTEFGILRMNKNLHPKLPFKDNRKR